MNTGRVTIQDCVNVPPPPDSRCQDPAFALQNPDICGVEAYLVIKPSLALVCPLGSLQLKAFLNRAGHETDVTSQTLFMSSDTTKLVIGAYTGNATGLSAGEVVINATFEDYTAQAELEVVGTDKNCCDDISVGMVVLVDNSLSMSQVWDGPAYGKKINCAKAVASRFIGEVNTTKDQVGLIQFNANSHATMYATQAAAAAIGETQQSTSFYDALETAIDLLDDMGVDLKALVIISDGEDQTESYASDNPISLLGDFKNAGGLVLCFGTRASGPGYSLLNAFSTGGFFVNCFDGVEESAIDYFMDLKGWICAGNCVDEGGETVPQGELDYADFQYWRVVDGHVDLIGDGFIDLLPGNGLYVDLRGSTAPYNGKMVLISPVTIDSVGDVYKLTLRIAGNQREVNNPSEVVAVKLWAQKGDAYGAADAISAAVTTGDVDMADESYDYYITWVNQYGESEPCAVESATVSHRNAKVTLTLPAAPSTADSVNVYRTIAGGGIVLLDTIEAVAVEATYEDTLRNDDVQALIDDGTIDPRNTVPLSDTTGTPIYYINTSIVIEHFAQGFKDYSFLFTLDVARDVLISIQQTSTPITNAANGVLLDRVILENSTRHNTPVFGADDFDVENPTAIPAGCGGSIWVDDDPLIIAGGEPLVPEMTGFDQPSGLVTTNIDPAASTGEAWLLFATYSESDFISGNILGEDPLWITYEFDAPKTVSSYRLWRNGTGGWYGPWYDPVYIEHTSTSWVLKGSNNGVDWDVLATVNDYGWPDYDWEDHASNYVTFALDTTPASYKYIKLEFEPYYTDPGGQTFGGIRRVQLLGDEEGGQIIPQGHYEYTYGCYGYGCPDEPDPEFGQDPDPLPDIEAGVTPPKVYEATKQGCVNCESNYVNLGNDPFTPQSYAVAACTDEPDITAQLDGARWELPLIPPGKNSCPNCDLLKEQIVTLHGNPAKTYDVALRIRGVVELRKIVAGSGTTLASGSYILLNTVHNYKCVANPTLDPSAGSVNQYWLIISNPYREILLNAMETGMVKVVGVDYEIDVQIAANATVRLIANSVDRCEAINSNNIKIEGVPPYPAAFDGQFLQMDVVSIEEA